MGSLYFHLVFQGTQKGPGVGNQKVGKSPSNGQGTHWDQEGKRGWATIDLGYKNGSWKKELWVPFPWASLQVIFDSMTDGLCITYDLKTFSYKWYRGSSNQVIK